MPNLDGVPAWGLFALACLFLTLTAVEKILKAVHQKAETKPPGDKGQAHMIRELHGWHDQRDADGVPAWFITTSLKQAVSAQVELAERQVELAEKTTDILETIRAHQVEHSQEHVALVQEIRRLSGSPEPLPEPRPHLRDAQG